MKRTTAQRIRLFVAFVIGRAHVVEKQPRRPWSPYWLWTAWKDAGGLGN